MGDAFTNISAENNPVVKDEKNGGDIFNVEGLTMAYGDYTVMRDLNFSVKKGEIFFIIGGSGCGKSTLLRHMIGLIKPAKGTIYFKGENFSGADQRKKTEMLRQFGVMYQGGALWTSMTLAENIALPLTEFTDITEKDLLDMIDLKLSLVGLNGFGAFYPSEISGGMNKRAGLARAMALDRLYRDSGLARACQHFVPRRQDFVPRRLHQDAGAGGHLRRTFEFKH